MTTSYSLSKGVTLYFDSTEAVGTEPSFYLDRGANLTNSGTIVTETPSLDSEFRLVGVQAQPDTEFVNSSTGVLQLFAPSYTGTVIGVYDVATVTNAGVIEAAETSKYAQVLGVADVKYGFTNTSSGLISVWSGGYGTGVAPRGAFTNDGLIEVIAGTSVGVYDQGPFVNHGTIIALDRTGAKGSIGLELAPELGSAAGQSVYTFVNSGTIEGDNAIYVDIHSGYPAFNPNVEIDNSGSLIGAVDLSAGNDTIVNTGLIEGAINLGEGYNIVDSSGGEITGPIYAGPGVNVVQLGGDGEGFYGDPRGGVDTITGSAGNDFISVASGADSINGGGGFNTLSFAEASGPLTVDLATGTASGLGAMSISDIQCVIGGNHRNTLIASGSGSELIAGSEKDTLIGGAGNDTLVAGAGGDLMTGGGGANTFVFSAGDKTLTVTDFDAATDVLEIFGYAEAESIAQVGANTVITLSSSDSIVLDDTNKAGLDLSSVQYESGAFQVPTGVGTAPKLSSSSFYFTNTFTVYAGEKLTLKPRNPFYAIEDDGYDASPTGEQKNGGGGYGNYTVNFYNLGSVVINSGPSLSTAGFFGDPLGSASGTFENEAGALFSVTGVIARGFEIPVGSTNFANSGVFLVSATQEAEGAVTWAPSFDFQNSGEIQVTSATSYATGIEMHNGCASFVNTGTIDVTGVTSATGVLWVNPTDHFDLVNMGAIIVSSPYGSNVGVDFGATSVDPVTLTNAGAIVASGGVAVSLGNANDLLIAEGGSTFVGAIKGAGGALDLNGGAAAGAIDGMSGFGSVDFASGASWLFEGNNSVTGGLDVGGGTVSVEGTISNAGTGPAAVYFQSGIDKLVLRRGAVLDGGAIGDGGGSTLEFSSVYDTLSTLGGAGVVSGQDSAAFTGFGVIDVGTGATITVAGAETIAAGQAVIDTGTLEVSGAVTSEGTLTLGGALSIDGALTLAGGAARFNTNGRLTADSIDLSGAATTVAADFEFDGPLTQEAGKVTVLSGDALTLDGAADDLGGTISGGGRLILGGASLVLQTGASLSVSQITIVGEAVSVTGAAKVAGAWVQDSGSLNLSSSDALTLTGIGNSIGVAVTGIGALVISGGTTTFERGASLGAASLDISGAATVVSLNTSLSYAGAWTQTAGKLAIGAGDTLTLVGSTEQIDGAASGAGALALTGGLATFGQGASLTIARVRESGVATQIDVNTSLTYAGAWDQTSGTLSAGAGDTFKLSGSGDAFSGTFAGAGTVEVTGAGDVLKTLDLANARTEINSVSATLQGTIGIAGLLSLTCPDLTLSSSSITRLTGGGVLQLSNLATNRLAGATSSAILQNLGDKIEGAGDLGGAALKLQNEVGGVIDGDDSNALIIDTGADSVFNAGLIEAVGAGGLTIDSPVNNTGTLAALGGDLTVDGAVSGAGSVRINGGVASFEGRITQAVTFLASGRLALADAVAYTGTISHFSKTGATSLDLEDIAFGAGTTETYSGTTASGVLTVTDGTHTARIKLAGNYLTSSFDLASDGSGGTLVTDPPPTAATLASAIAAFAPAASAADAGYNAAPASARPPLIAVPPG